MASTRLILRSSLAVGDSVLLTAAVRDLHRIHPGQFQTDVRTPHPELWLNNPHVTALPDYGPGVQLLDCEPTLAGGSHHRACHALHAFHDWLNGHLGTRLQPTEFHGDIHLTPAERRRPTLVGRLAGRHLPFWLISAGGRFDLTVKWWDHPRYQAVVDHFRGRVQFVQVGALTDHHPRLEGVIDLRGQTSLRDLVLLMHHAEGVVCGVTGLMHLAAAVPRRTASMGLRPCVVVAGGRESPVWEAYPGHQFLHTVGQLACCAHGGCWKHRTLPLGDDPARDLPERLCVDVRGQLPHCMDRITAADVIRSMEPWLEHGQATTLDRGTARAAERAVRASEPNRWFVTPLSRHNAPAAAREFIRNLPPPPFRFAGRGVVIPCGGVRLFANAWVCFHRLRAMGCDWPVQFWHLGAGEFDPAMRRLAESLGIECVDALALAEQHPVRHLHGWGLKAYAIAYSRFAEVLLLDADNVPVRNPAELIDTAPYRRHGAVFWPDYGRLGPKRLAWEVFDVPYRDEREFESGQLLVDKHRHWDAVRLSLWYNEHADCFYQHVHGDKDTFHLAFRRLGRPYAMPARPIHSLPGVICQHNFAGRRLFQHRNSHKWDLLRDNPRIRGFQDEDACRGHLADLRSRWDCRLGRFFPRAEEERARPGRPVKIMAFMASCAARRRQREKSLASLGATDWGREPVHLVMDQERFAKGTDRLIHSCWRALTLGLQGDADYFLWLEDDVAFNRHFRHNLESWVWLTHHRIGFATLYHPRLPELGWDPAGHAALVKADDLMGTQAVLLSREFAARCLKHWTVGPAHLDLKLAALAARWHAAVPAHSPSLVQHTGAGSTLANPYHVTPYFNPDWKSPLPPPAP